MPVHETPSAVCSFRDMGFRVYPENRKAADVIDLAHWSTVNSRITTNHLDVANTLSLVVDICIIIPYIDYSYTNLHMPKKIFYFIKSLHKLYFTTLERIR